MLFDLRPPAPPLARAGLGLLAATLALAPAPPPDPGAERTLAARVDGERAAGLVRELVGLGPRMGGTPSGERAARWLAAAFEGLGLQVRVHEDPEVWCHTEERWSLVVRGAGEPEPLEGTWPWGFSPTSAGAAQLALEPAPGAALLCERVPRALRRGGSAEGAPACVLVDGATTLDGRYPVVHHLPEGDANPAPVFGLSQPAGAALRERLAAGEALRVEWELEATIRRAPPLTVEARLAARPGAPPGHVLFCAHGDSDAGGPGANDNASGVAILLEIARAWSEAVAAGEVAPPEREVRFAVWGDEIHSSRAWLERARAAGEETLAVFNFDQSGYGSAFDRLYVEPDDLEVNGPLLAGVVAALREHAGDELFPERWATVRSLGGTDSYVFSGAEPAPVPALTFYASAWGEPAEHPRTAGQPGESWNDGDVVHVDHDVHYHSAGDVPELTTDREPFNMAWSARVALLGARRFLAALGEPAR